MNSKRTKKNHYNPKGYLKRFAGSDGKVSGYNHDYKKSSRKEYQAWGFETGLYDQNVEDTLEQVDDRFCKAMDRFEEVLDGLDKGQRLETKYLGDIATFLTLQLQRTPKAKNAVAEIIETLNKQNPISQNQFGREILEKYFDKDKYFQKLMFDTGEEVFKVLTSYEWRILRAEQGSCFITNDAVFASATTDLQLNSEGIGLKSQKALKFSLYQKSYAWS